MALEDSEVACLAVAYQRVEPLGNRSLPVTRIEDDVRKIDCVPRSRLLNMRYQEPRRNSGLSAADISELHAADAFLVLGNARAALAAYREELVAEPESAAWIGLALAFARLSAASLQVFTTGLPLLFEMHAHLAGQGIYADPLDLAAWFE